MEAQREVGFICQRNNNNSSFPCFPPGYKFKPTDEELVVSYLMKKLRKEPLPFNEIMKNIIRDVELYEHKPETLVENCENYGEQEWYFFTSRARKYPNGQRPDRAAGDGFWKANSAEVDIKSERAIAGYKKGDVVGHKRVLTFFRGKAPRGEKSDWILHEYRINNTSSTNAKNFDDVVLCRMYKKSKKSEKPQQSQYMEESKAGNSPESEISNGSYNPVLAMNSYNHLDVVYEAPMEITSMAYNHLQSNASCFGNYYSPGGLKPIMGESMFTAQQSSCMDNFAAILERPLAIDFQQTNDLFDFSDILHDNIWDANFN